MTWFDCHLICGDIHVHTCKRLGNTVVLKNDNKIHKMNLKGGGLGGLLAKSASNSRGIEAVH